MNEKDLRKLSRADLLEMLIDQSIELQTVRDRLSVAEEALQKKLHLKYIHGFHAASSEAFFCTEYALP